MNYRIKELRKRLGVNQEEFGERIGITKSSVSLLESGKNTPSKQTVQLMCKEFHVDENWLKTGEGEMFTIDPEEDEMAVYIEELIDGTDDSVKSLIKSILKAYCKMTPKSKAVFNKLVDDCLEDMGKGKD